MAAGILLANNFVLSFYAGTLGLPVWLGKLLTEVTLFLVSLTVQAKWVFRKNRDARNENKEVESHGTNPSAKAA